MLNQYTCIFNNPASCHKYIFPQVQAMDTDYKRDVHWMHTWQINTSSMSLTSWKCCVPQISGGGLRGSMSSTGCWGGTGRTSWTHLSPARESGPRLSQPGQQRRNWLHRKTAGRSLDEELDSRLITSPPSSRETHSSTCLHISNFNTVFCCRKKGVQIWYFLLYNNNNNNDYIYIYVYIKVWPEWKSRPQKDIF